MYSGTAGDAGLIRVGLPLLAGDPRSCPRGLALRARPLIKQSPARDRRKPLEDFPLGPIMRGLDVAEHKVHTNSKECHPVHQEWSEHAIGNYLKARRDYESWLHTRGLPITQPVSGDWVVISDLREPDQRGATRYERTAWGRRYASADGSIRELWLLSVNDVKETRSDEQIAAAAHVAMYGVAAVSEFGAPYVRLPRQSGPAATVRIIAVGCGDGKWALLGEWDAAAAAARYDRIARPALARMVSATDVTPGSDCVSCEGLLGCSEPPRAPGLLGTSPVRGRTRRSVSATDLRVHERCPAQFYATRVLHLRGRADEPAPIRRGRMVDSWLNEQHTVRRRNGCRITELPEALPGLDPGDSAAALRMLGHHRAVCPLDGLPDQETVRPQPRLTAYDPVADVVVIADPDLLYTDRGGWVWRETKTATGRPWQGRPLLETFPQLALAVLLMSAGVPGGDPRRSRIELEILYADRPAACEEIDPFDEATLRQARSVVFGLAVPWAVDTRYPPKPGQGCSTCEVRSWCPGRQA
ncbi:PD-(D/E)XK nuclease family protein [Streptosporangium saharense]|uniref:PD-(D/E)XK nuclease family protein n=1 Tax=Streptosporangium saharense TaxID=1706840 RepID=UPI0036C60564